MDLALNNLQRLICHKTQTNKWTQWINSILNFLTLTLLHCERSPDDIVANMMYYIIMLSLNSSRTIMFTFRQMLLEKV